MTDLDELPFSPPATAPNAGAAPRRPCRHLQRDREYATGALGERVLLGERCVRDGCRHLITVEKMRRAKLAIRAGKDTERRLAARTPGGRRVGQFNGPIDVQEGLFVTQSKEGPGTFSNRYWHWLQALPRTGGTIPRLVVSDGRRSMTVYITSDDESLHGDGREVA